MRNRTKLCFECHEEFVILYRCKIIGLSSWRFLCSSCLKMFKSKGGYKYRYGGTWKATKA